jgi:T-complex protein 1 subunit eta
VVQVGAERFNLFKGCPKARTATMVLRGGSDQFIDEAERSLHDAIMIVRRAIKNASVVAGGGAIDMEISRCARYSACSFLPGKTQTWRSACARGVGALCCL